MATTQTSATRCAPSSPSSTTLSIRNLAATSLKPSRCDVASSSHTNTHSRLIFTHKHTQPPHLHTQTHTRAHTHTHTSFTSLLHSCIPHTAQSPLPPLPLIRPSLPCRSFTGGAAAHSCGGGPRRARPLRTQLARAAPLPGHDGSRADRLPCPPLISHALPVDLHRPPALAHRLRSLLPRRSSRSTC